MVDKIAHFQQRLAETIAWCASKEWAGNPAEKLRSLELRPTELKEQDDTILDWRAPPRQRQEIVEQLATKRAELLQEQGIPPFQLALPLAGGRLLAFALDHTLSDGAASVATNGFFDGDNIPAWDTWITYTTDDPAITLRWRNGVNSYLLSWIPEPLVEVVADGLAVNPEDCILWTTDLTSAFMRQLRQAGLLR